MDTTEPTPFSKKGPYLMRIFLILIVVVVIFAVLTGIIVYYIERQKPDEILGILGQQLVDDTGKERGIARKERDGDVWRIFATIKLEEPSESRTYHGWFLNEYTQEIRYAGEFFQKEDGIYTLTYTTEEDVGNFRIFQVSSESKTMPEKPANNIAQWEFEPGRVVEQ